MYRFSASVLLMAVLYSFGVINLQGQGLGSLSFIHELSEKRTATVDDAFRILLLTLEKNPGTFKQNMMTLSKMGLIKRTDYSKNMPLRLGLVAYMVAKQLKLKDSFMFLIFKTERYAHRACAADDIMSFNQSARDLLSGDELIEVMGVVGSRLEGTNE
jgi:hypothetical protein